MSGISSEKTRVVSRRRVDDTWKLFYKEISGPLYKETGKHIDFPSNFEEAYQLVRDDLVVARVVG